MKGQDVAQRLRAQVQKEIERLEAGPASDAATARQIAMLDVRQFLDSGWTWIKDADRPHDTEGDCWCNPERVAVAAGDEIAGGGAATREGADPDSAEREGSSAPRSGGVSSPSPEADARGTTTPAPVAAEGDTAS